MFGKRKGSGDDSGDGAVTGNGQDRGSEPTLGNPRSAQSDSSANRRRHSEGSGRPLGSLASAARARGAQGEDGGLGRRLVVGREIRLTGEINKCQMLVVEGQVEANLTDCVGLEITGSGLFKGTAVVEQAEISGRFEGELSVTTRLFVRSSGRLNGKIRYGDLEIERGGRIAGQVDVIETQPEAKPAQQAQGKERNGAPDQGTAETSGKAKTPGKAETQGKNGAKDGAAGGDNPKAPHLPL